MWCCAYGVWGYRAVYGILMYGCAWECVGMQGCEWDTVHRGAQGVWDAHTQGFTRCMEPLFMGVHGGCSVTNETVVHGVNWTLMYRAAWGVWGTCAVGCIWLQGCSCVGVHEAERVTHA